MFGSEKIRHAQPGIQVTGDKFPSDGDSDSIVEFNTGKDKNESVASGELESVAGSEPKLGIETSKTGSIALKDYVNYLKRGARYCGLLASMLLYLITMALFSAYDLLLANWTNQANQIHLQSVSHLVPNTTSNPMPVDIFTHNKTYLMILGIIELALIVFAIFRSWTFFAIVNTSGRKIHNAMLRSLIAAKIDFFQFHSAGMTDVHTL
ncbi:unnamed protein product [Dibothriocephalus latus]|uniref:ABC transmembrane type-1 domain-containing protein n=1 Tax=Dibothriocephalus latus TaxID=60516 RepID=A0A3P7LKP2_DIBLA|nr:unnamed protein product [Dibothriocephalus latus]